MKRHLGKTIRKELALVDGLARSISRPDLAVILEGAAPSDPRLEKMFKMMFDPVFADYKLSSLARECGVSFVELSEVIKNHRKAEGIVLMSRHAPRVMEDVATDALNTMEFCPDCKGIGSIFDPINKALDGSSIPIACPRCKGAGEIKRTGDAGARKLVFDSLGLTAGRGPLIAVQNNTLNAGDGDDLESILAMGKRKSLSTPTITVEQVKESE